MKSDTFHCPSCRAVLKKSAAAWVMGEIADRNDTRFVGLGAPAATVTCPACGSSIDTAAMIAGKYDPGISRADIAGVLTMIGLALVLIFGFEVPVWVALLIAVVLGGVVIMAFGAVSGKRR